MKAKLIPELLARCLAEIQSGQLSMEECLADHPAEDAELRPLLETALALSSPPPFRPDPTFRMRGRVALVEAISAENGVVTPSPLRRFWIVIASGWGSPPHSTTRRKRMTALIVGLVLMLAASLGGGATYASQEALPGDALYQVKMALEGLQEAFAESDEAKMQVSADCARNRLDETQRAIRDGRADAAQTAAGDYAGCVARVEQHLTQAAASGKDVTILASTLSDNLARQQAALAAAEERAPEPARSAVSKAAEKAEKGLSTAIAIATSGRPSSEGQVPNVTGALTGTLPLGQPDGKQDIDRDNTRGKPGATVAISGTIALTFTQTISDVRNLPADPEVPGQSFKGVLAKLDAARASLGRGQGDVAVHNLDAFLNELNAMRRSGHISSENYDKLYSDYTGLVNSLGGTPGAQVPPRSEEKPEKSRPEGPGKPNTSPSPQATPVITPTQVVSPTLPIPGPEDSRDRPRGRPNTSPSPQATPIITPTQVVSPTLSPTGPGNSRDHPEGKPEDTPRRPTPDAAPTQAPPTASPLPTKPGREQDTPRGRSGDQRDEGPDHPAPAAVPAQPAQPPETAPAKSAQPPSPPLDRPSSRSDTPQGERERLPNTR